MPHPDRLNLPGVAAVLFVLATAWAAVLGLAWWAGP